MSLAEAAGGSFAAVFAGGAEAMGAAIQQAIASSSVNVNTPQLSFPDGNQPRLDTGTVTPF